MVMANAVDAGTLTKGTKITAARTIPGRSPGVTTIEEGTPGKVIMASGFGPWMRYWVRFDLGDRTEAIGSIDRENLFVPGVDDASDTNVGWLFS